MSRCKRMISMPHVYCDTMKGEIKQLWQLYLKNKYKINIREIKEEIKDSVK